MFSWLDCKTKEQVKAGRRRKVYVLIPERFGGGHVTEGCYEGYGRFGGHDVYDLVAEWNRTEADFHGVEGEGWSEWHFHGRDKAEECFSAFRDGTDDAEMQERFGKDYKRIIGIIIAAYDDDNARLRYPIKITHDPDAVYEWCAPSKSDPNQGW